MKLRSISTCVALILGIATGSAIAQSSNARMAAQQLGFSRVSTNPSNAIDYLGGRSSVNARSAAEVAQALEKNLGTLLGFDSVAHRAVVQSQDSSNGQRYYRVQQMYQGIPVYGGEVVVQADADGSIVGVMGRAKEFNISTAVAGTKFETLLNRALVDFAARENVGAPSARGLYASNVRIVNAPTRMIYAAHGPATMTWDTTVEFLLGNKRHIERLWIDAQSGQLVAADTQIHTAINRSIHNLNGGCVAAFGGATLPGALVVSEGGTTTDTIAQAAYNHSGTVYWYYKNAFNRDAIENNGGVLKSSVRVTFGQLFATNCTGANAAWIGTDKLMVFGNGDANNFKDLTSGGDVAYHEMTHGVTNVESNLAYQKESGGINEGMSDIFAAAAESWLINLQGRGLTPGAGASIAYTVSPRVWQVGEEIVKPTFGRAALRFMDDPEADNYSVDHYADYQTKWGDACSPSSNNDNCGVHGSSGIPNLAFKMMVTGGTHPRGQTTVQVPAIGMADAIRVFYEANVNLLTSSATFQGLRNATVQAATTFWGANSCQRNAITLAWNAVGVPGDTAANPAACGGGGNVAPTANYSFATNGLTATFTDSSTDSDGTIASRSWNFGDGTTSTVANPSKTYSAAGTYNVQLTVTDNGGLSGTVTKAVTVSAAANVAPTANFSFSTSGLTATFIDSSTDSDGTIASRSWNFGDGTTSTATSPSKTYTAAGTYNVTLTVTDNGGLTNAKTSSVTVTAPPTTTVLSNGVPVTGLSAATGTSLNYTMVVPAGATGLKFVMSGGTGDADMYVKFGSAPTDSVYDCRPFATGNNETCNIATAQAGTYHVRLKSYAAFAGVSLTGSFTAPAPGAQTYSSTTVFNVADNTTINSPITVAGRTGNASATAQVSVNITHTYQGDLKVDLVAPDGTLYNLHNRTGSGTDNVIKTVTLNLSSEVMNGTWNMRVQDAATGDTGRLNSWSMTF